MLEKTISTDENICFKDAVKPLRNELSVLQLRLREAKLPVIIIFEGWGASGKGSLIADMIKRLDPRFFKVKSTLAPNETESRYPMMKRYWQNIPEYGKMEILDRSWYSELAVARIEDKNVDDKEYIRRVDKVNVFERQLTDDGYLVIKFFLHISKIEQKKRFDKLREKSSTEWRVTKLDRERNRRYDEYYGELDDMLARTDTEWAHWNIIDAHEKNSTEYVMFNKTVQLINERLTSGRPQFGCKRKFPVVSMPKLENIPLNETFSPDEYEKELEKQQKRLVKLHGKLYKKKISVILAFEGWDAAGKGGAIKRLACALDPRGCEAIPTAAPDKTELNHHYLWRFWNNIPKSGHIAIFDRTWYGRVMVERLEKFTPPERWSMAYSELNEFEKELTDSGTVIMKFWLQIDKDEQLKRFTERQNTPEKQWKITEEDWRNREKWDDYQIAVNEMLQKTSTQYAPWFVIEANDKLYARIKILTLVADRIEQALKNTGKK